MKNTKTTASFLGFLFFGALSIFGQSERERPANNLPNFKPQVAIKSGLIEANLRQELSFSAKKDKWANSVRPTFSRKHTASEIQDLKNAKYISKQNSYIKHDGVEPKSSVATPIIGLNYEANWSVVSAPSDNSMAISNGGYVVTTNNDGCEYYDPAGTLLYSQYWADVFADPSLTSILYDPKIVYDSQEDRFVLIVLHGSTGSTSQVIVSFSKTNNPIDGWWVYNLTGNPLNNDCWFDYPNVGVSNDEVFVTGNLFTTSGTFNQAIVYQIPKGPGFSGGAFNWQYWSGLDNTILTATTLIPAMSGQQGNVGPGMYFVSNQSGGNNKIVLWDLTSNISGNPQLNNYSVNTTAYSPSADANQQGSGETLDNGDCRIQNAFYLNGLIHFVFHSDVGSGWNGINYNRLNVSSATNVSTKFGQAGSFDISYPAVASFSTNSTDKSVMIAYLRSSPSIFPEVRVINCDNDLNWSNSTLVKAGEASVDILTGNERWGDYTGVGRRHNSATPKIWLAGCYGANIPQASAMNTYKTWVAEVSGQNQPVSVEEKTFDKEISIFPVPCYDFINIHFTTEIQELITIEILDIQGKLIKLLYKDSPKTGTNKLSFNKEALAEGTYFVKIYSPTKILKNEKIIVLN